MTALDSSLLPDWVADLVDWDRALTSAEERMGLAIELAALNVEADTGGPFGAIVVDTADGRLLGVGVNRVVPLGNSVHAEAIAVMGAERRVGSFSLAGQARELYSSCAPCAMCLGAIHWSGSLAWYAGPHERTPKRSDSTKDPSSRSRTATSSGRPGGGPRRAPRGGSRGDAGIPGTRRADLQPLTTRRPTHAQTVGAELHVPFGHAVSGCGRPEPCTWIRRRDRHTTDYAERGR